MAESKGQAVATGAASGALLGLLVAGPVGALMGGAVGAGATAVVQKSDMMKAVTGVQIPANGMQVQGGCTFFAVDVFLTCGPPHRVMKTFADFEILRSTLQSSGGLALSVAEHPMFGVEWRTSNAPIPCCACCPCFTMNDHEKRSKCESWLNHMVKKGNASWDPSLNSFLELNAYQQQTQPAAYMQQQQMQPAAYQQQQMQQPLMQPVMQVEMQQVPAYAHAVATQPTAPLAAPLAAPPAAPPAAVAGGIVEELKQLAALKQSGVLSDEEFADAKARVLANQPQP